MPHPPAVIAYATARSAARLAHDRHQRAEANAQTTLAARAYTTSDRAVWPALDRVCAALNRDMSLTDPDVALLAAFEPA